MRQAQLFALTSTPWCEETDNTAGLSSSRCSTCLMTTRSVFFNVLHYMSLCWLLSFVLSSVATVYAFLYLSGFSVACVSCIMPFCFLPMQKSDVNMLLYIADNLACFPYQSQEEPLFIMHHVDITLSVSGSNLLQSFKEVCCFFFFFLELTSSCLTMLPCITVFAKRA